MNHDGWDYFQYWTPDNVYLVNLCGTTAADCHPNSSVCIRRPKGTGFVFESGGLTETQTFSATKGHSVQDSVTVSYSEGHKCGSGSFKTNIEVNCLETADPGFFYDLRPINDCEVTLSMYSVHGCGKPFVDSSSGKDFSESRGIQLIPTAFMLLLSFVLVMLKHWFI